MKHQLKVYVEEPVGKCVRQEDLVAEIVRLANDIDQYLQSDVPLECYRKDIGHKLQSLIDSLSDEQQETIWADYFAQEQNERTANEHRKGSSHP